ncbi:DUF1656 domain-containing protein [Acetobacter sp. AN02]|uniref:DUF1656 domain-containing protein n=1 Tax=Acetobacter sp. AN02 TaxID=2894186 RepID=UPI0024341FE7|nr:DUF1656 domain-containing protein [Acetobacter sp. AN02]MDG6093836.1 DUF1656 domain-containing protein [Acetobacter sp. AN02]
MVGEMKLVYDVGGLLVSGFAVHVLLAFTVLLILRPLFARIGLSRFVWNMPLAEFGIFLILTGVFLAVL